MYAVLVEEMPNGRYRAVVASELLGQTLAQYREHLDARFNLVRRPDDCMMFF